MLLALDTATDQASVALFDGDVRAEESWIARRRHGDELFPAVVRVLELAGAGLGAVTRVAVASGPGSFTGLRVAIAAAQGIARGCGVPLVAVATLDVLAFPHRGRPVCAALRAGRQDFYHAFYGVEGRRAASGFALGALSDFCRDDGTVFVGDFSTEDEAMLTARGVALAPRSARMRRAGVLAELAWNLEPPRGPVEPIYVRQPAIGGRR